MTPLRLEVATWNVHGFVGSDGRRDPARTAAVLRSLDADVIALQEVDGGREPDTVDAFEALGASLGYQAVEGPTLERASGRFGNLLLTRHPVRREGLIDLSRAPAEPRGAIDVGLDVGGVRVRVLATHLGLGRHERAVQASQLCAALDAGGDDDLVVLLGDLNEWRPLPRTGLAPLLARFAHRGRRRTFPSRAPLLPLDRILVDRREARVRLGVVVRAPARAASDHLALRASIELDTPGKQRGGAR